MITEGIVSFGLASNYKDKNLTPAQRDDETGRRFKVETPTVKIQPPGNSKVSTLRNIKNVSIRFGLKFPYYLRSFACVYSEQLFTEFDSDACLQINDVGEFEKRFRNSFESQYPDWTGYSGVVKYIDLQNPTKKYTQIEILFLKDRKDYSAQGEFRMAIIPPEKAKLSKRANVDLGSLQDISEVILKP